ncbi:hypothetical protein SAMN05216582_10167 [Selenomonas ruminantium]|uniref:Haemolysin activator HlyB C-terminal domain-containing protein n=1 Tax=Selenomonas ruminantium TaxID=971 RepID=A0A1M6QZ85_SELRU|nr:hypothetical protein [Selenomonas ruminantium]SHK25569.1 hypothetical protein SAMN05216582_10167 [Selenomonas ruminantium]
MNSITLKGWGIGVNYAHSGDYFLRLDYARRIGWDDNLLREGESRQRIWFLAGKVF